MTREAQHQCKGFVGVDDADCIAHARGARAFGEGGTGDARYLFGNGTDRLRMQGYGRPPVCDSRTWSGRSLFCDNGAYLSLLSAVFAFASSLTITGESLLVGIYTDTQVKSAHR